MSSFRAFGLKIGAGSGSTKTFRRSAWLQVMAFLLGLSPQLAKTQLAIETIVNYYCSLLSNKLLIKEDSERPSEVVVARASVRATVRRTSRDEAVVRTATNHRAVYLRHAHSSIV